MTRSPWLQKRGAAAIRTPLLIFAGLLLVVLVLKYGSPLIKYYQVRQVLTKIAQDSAHLSENDFELELRRRLASVRPPFPPEDVAITRVGDHLILDVLYKVEINLLPGYYTHVLTFNPHVEEKVPAGSYKE
jgi:hypothetical protein